MARTKLSQSTKIVPCYVCHRDLVVNGYTRTPQRCLECGITASVEAVRQMKAKAGPVYERYLAAMAIAALRNRWGTPSPDRTVNLTVVD